MSKNQHFFLFFLDKLLDARLAYHDIKNNEEARKTSGLLGKRAIIYDILFILFAAGGAACFVFGGSFLDSGAIFLGIILMILAVALLVMALIYVVLALNCAVKQLCLNRRAIGWISLILPLAAIGAIIGGVFLLGGLL